MRVWRGVKVAFGWQGEVQIVKAAAGEEHLIDGIFGLSGVGDHLVGVDFGLGVVNRRGCGLV